MKRLVVVMATLMLAGCTKQPTPPSTSLKLVCRNGGQQLVFLMDTLTHTAVLANLPDAPHGTYSTSAYEYRFSFPETRRVRAGAAVVNRYDGEMIREMGKPPYALDGITIPEGNVVYTWKCERAEAKPIL